jgi:hypothetical protein
VKGLIKMKKKYIHIREYQLTKLILDYLDIDEEEGKLYYGALPLQYKTKFFTLVPYKEMKDFKDDDLVPIRPFTNVSHCQYLINLFSDIFNCESLFEYKSMEDNDKLLEGNMKLTYPKETKKLKFYGVKNLNLLMGGMLSKMVLSHDKFKENIGSILKLDEKVTDSKKSKS